MATDYSDWLAVHVLNERQLVSFRSVSRALKVNNNLAKQMLFDFHHRQNTRKPGSVHATYLISGSKIRQQVNGIPSQHDEDSVMQSDSIFPGSSIPGQDGENVDQLRMKSIVIVKEAQLEQAKAKFEHIVGIHVYSLQAEGLSDIQALTECNRSIASSYSSEDPLKAWKQYGTIQNQNVKRRTGKSAPPPPPPASKAKLADTTVKPATSAPKAASSAKAQPDSQPASQESTKTEPSKPSLTKPTNVKRQDSNLFKSFAKASAAASKTKKSDPTDSSAAPTPDPDTSMTGFSDEDDDVDGETALPEELKDIKAHDQSGKSRKEREAELQAMMDKEDEPMADAEDEAKPADEVVDGDDDGKMDEDDDNDDGALDGLQTKAKNEPQQQQESVTVENGRRRGRRKVMKKKTVKDEEGYLVTREEPGWESFSEEEPAPKKPKIEVAAVAGAASGSKKSGGGGGGSGEGAAGGKKGGKPGQGNIMSFFSKK